MIIKTFNQVDNQINITKRRSVPQQDLTIDSGEASAWVFSSAMLIYISMFIDCENN